MKTKLITTLFILVSLHLSSQINQSIDFITGLEISDRILILDNQTIIPIQLIDPREENENAKFNWRLGANFNQRINNTLFFKTGLRLTSIGYQLKFNTSLVFPGTPSSNITTLKLKEDYWFFEIPLVIRKELGKKKWTPFVELGILPSIYLTSRFTSISAEERRAIYDRNLTREGAKFQLVGFFSLGLNYSINDAIQVFCQPAFRYHFTNLFDSSLNTHLYNYGIEFGVRQVISSLSPVIE